MSEDSSRVAYRRWYENHKDSFNAKRRERYRSDPEYRQRQIAYKRSKLIGQTKVAGG